MVFSKLAKGQKIEWTAKRSCGQETKERERKTEDLGKRKKNQGENKTYTKEG